MATFKERFRIRKFNTNKVDGWSSSARNDRVFLFAWIVWVLVLIVAVAYLFFSEGKLPVQVPLFYSRPWGEDQLAQKAYLWLLPGGAFLLSLSNFGFAVFLHKEDAFLARTLSWVAVAVAVLTTFSLVNIIQLLQ